MYCSDYSKIFEAIFFKETYKWLLLRPTKSYYLTEIPEMTTNACLKKWITQTANYYLKFLSLDHPVVLWKPNV